VYMIGCCRMYTAAPAVCAVGYAGVRAALLNDRYVTSHRCPVSLLDTQTLVAQCK